MYVCSDAFLRSLLRKAGWAGLAGGVQGLWSLCCRAKLPEPSCRPVPGAGQRGERAGCAGEQAGRAVPSQPSPAVPPAPAAIYE